MYRARERAERECSELSVEAARSAQEAQELSARVAALSAELEMVRRRWLPPPLYRLIYYILTIFYANCIINGGTKGLLFLTTIKNEDNLILLCWERHYIHPLHPNSRNKLFFIS